MKDEGLVERLSNRAKFLEDLAMYSGGMVRAGHLDDAEIMREAAAALKEVRERALEEAARECDAEARAYLDNCEACEKSGNEIGATADFHGMKGAEHCAFRIRSLKSISAGGEKREDVHLAGGANERDERGQD